MNFWLTNLACKVRITKSSLIDESKWIKSSISANLDFLASSIGGVRTLVKAPPSLGEKVATPPVGLSVELELCVRLEVKEVGLGMG